ncbi:MAG: hypothetical protein HY234_02460 [Acidobacteria bacterium]|nr:hypothetical protein [Acidobacteriota bacterium]MBI3661897.1 hypothetical protein [Acidobacteriota bacterium]
MPRERERWFYEQRAYPLKQIPAGIRQKAIERLEEMRRAERQRAQAPGIEALIQAGQSAWTPIGPQPGNSSFFGAVSGRIGAIAADPTDANTVYLGGAQGGVWKTTDGGQNWTALTDSQPSLAVGAIAIDPSSCTPAPCRTIYVGTGEQTFSSSSYYGAGVLKSIDAGATWTQLGTPPGSPFVGPFGGSFSQGGARISAIAVKRDGSVILAGVDIGNGATGSGVYRSMDGGATWTLVSTASGATASDVLFSPDPARPGDAYAALGSPGGSSLNGVYKSTDSGQTWARADAAGTSKLPTASVGVIKLAIARSAPSTLYASIVDVLSDDLLGFFKSIDGGLNWTQLTATPNYCAGQCFYDNVVRVHPNNANVIYVGGSATSGFFSRSTDGGVTWSAFLTTAVPAEFIHVDQHAMDFGFLGPTAVKLYLGNDGGVWSADVSNPTASTLTWTNLNGTLQLAQFYPGNSIHPSDEQIGMGGTQDNDTLKFTGALPWETIGPGCDGGYTVIDRALPSAWYFMCQFGVIFKSIVNGAPGSGNLAINGINPLDLVAFIPPMIGDPNVPDRLYFGTSRIYQTNDGAQNWVAISPDLTNSIASLRAIAVAPSDSNVVYTGARNARIFRTVNAGAGVNATWSEISSAIDLPSRVITAMAVHPADPNTAFVAFSGFTFGSDTKGHIFKTTNGGATWTDIRGTGAGALPNTPVNAIAIDPDFAPVGNRIFIGTDVGVFETTDGGATWATLVTGLPRVAVLSLQLRRASRTLRAGTHGRGMWDLQYSALPAYTLSSVSPSSFAPGSGPASITVRGNGFTASSVVHWNGAPLNPTTFTSATQLDATVPNSLLVGGPPAQVTVVDSVLGPTNALLVTILNPSPQITSLSPTSVASGSGSFTLTVNGAGFVPTTEINWDGSSRVTTFVSSAQVTAQITAADIATSGKFRVTAFNPLPGGGASSPLIFSVTGPGPVNDDFNNAINASPAPFMDTKNSGFATANTGGRLDPVISPGTCTTGAASNGAANSIWYKFTPVASGAVIADTFGSVYDTILTVVTGSPGAFTVVACNDDPPGQFSAPSLVSFTATAGTTYFFMISAWAGDGGTTTFNLDFFPPPPNDDLGGATPVGTLPFFDLVNSMAATVQSTDPIPTCALGALSGGRAKSTWYRFTPSANGTVTADTRASLYDTILSAFSGNPGALTEVACNDDFGGSPGSQVSFNVTAGATYHFMVSAAAADGGFTVFGLTSTAAPGPDYSLSASPVAPTVNRGQPASVTITVTPVVGAFTSAVALTCSGLPSLSTCSFSPASVTPGSNPANSTLTITTTAGSGLAAPLAAPVSPPPVLLWTLAAMALLSLAMLVGRVRKTRFARALVLTAVMLSVALLLSCGGGGGGNPPPPPQPGTTPGTYTVTVTGAAGTTQRIATVTLTVR